MSNAGESRWEGRTGGVGVATYTMVMADHQFWTKASIKNPRTGVLLLQGSKGTPCYASHLFRLLGPITISSFRAGGPAHQQRPLGPRPNQLVKKGKEGPLRGASTCYLRENASVHFHNQELHFDFMLENWVFGVLENEILFSVWPHKLCSLGKKQEGCSICQVFLLPHVKSCRSLMSKYWFKHCPLLNTSPEVYCSKRKEAWSLVPNVTFVGLLWLWLSCEEQGLETIWKLICHQADHPYGLFPGVQRWWAPFLRPFPLKDSNSSLPSSTKNH